jgi:FAD dependent oxidoreductase
MIEPTRLLGGQFTSQLVCPPDENRFIETPGGPSTFRYRTLRGRVRQYAAATPHLISGREDNIGSCWVSRISGTPDLWEKAIGATLYPALTAETLQVLTRHQLVSVTRFENGRVNYADVVNLDTGRVTRIACKFLLDATEDGDALVKSGGETLLGQEARSEHNEPNAPETAHPEWVQSFTYCFLVEWWGGANSTTVTAKKPNEYEHFKSLGEYTLDYVYSHPPPTRIVPYKVLTTATGASGPFWTYRRLLAQSNFTGGKSPAGDIALINWRGNDFHEESYIGKPLSEQVRILERGHAFAEGFLYWLQTECPRDDGRGIGYPEMQLASLSGADGFALHPYVRESRRLKAQFTLTQNHLLAPVDNPTAKWGTLFPDSIGCALYAVDIHPAQGEPPILAPALPYHIPLGAFIPVSGPTNILPAAKNFGATRLALASARMHPTEWLIGEVAGHLASFCLKNNIDSPATVRENPEHLKVFLSDLKDQGITLSWQDILGE